MAQPAVEHATKSGYLYFQTLPAQDVEYHAGQEVLVTLRSEKNTGRAIILATPDSITSGAFAGRYLVHFHQDDKQCHARQGRMTPVYDVPRSVVVCASTTDYRRLARCQVTKEDDVLEIGSSYGIATDIIAQHARSVIGVDNSHEMVAQARLRYPHLRFEVIDALNDQQPLAQLAAGRPVVFVDVGGNRQLESLVQLLPWIEDNLVPRLMVVKSERLVAAANEHMAQMQGTAQQEQQGQQKQNGQIQQVNGQQLNAQKLLAQQQGAQQQRQPQAAQQQQQQRRQQQQQRRQQQQQQDSQQQCQLSQPPGGPGLDVASSAPTWHTVSGSLPAATGGEPSICSISAMSTPSSTCTAATTAQAANTTGDPPAARGAAAAAANGVHSQAPATTSSRSNGSSSPPTSSTPAPTSSSHCNASSSLDLPTTSMPTPAQPQLSGLVHNAAAWWEGLVIRCQLASVAPGQPPPVEGWYLAAAQSNWKRNPLRVPKRYVIGGLQMCRFHNYRHRCFDGDDCPLDHDHCHYCGQLGHRALNCPVPVLPEELRQALLKQGQQGPHNALIGDGAAHNVAVQIEAVASE